MNRVEVLAKELAEWFRVNLTWDAFRSQSDDDLATAAAAALDAALAAQEGERESGVCVCGDDLEHHTSEHNFVDSETHRLAQEGERGASAVVTAVEAVLAECDARVAKSPDRVLTFWVRRLRAALEGERGGVEVAALREEVQIANERNEFLRAQAEDQAQRIGAAEQAERRTRAAAKHGEAEIAAIESLCAEVETRFREGRMSRAHVPISEIRAALADPAGALATHDAEMLREYTRWLFDKQNITGGRFDHHADDFLADRIEAQP